MNYIFTIVAYEGEGYRSVTLEVKSETDKDALRKAKCLITKDHYVIKKIQEVF